MAHIDALIDTIAEPALRDALREQVDVLLHKRSFGLVFQEHRPETVELPRYKVRRGCDVRLRSETDNGSWTVKSISGDTATLTSTSDESVTRDEALANLVVIREFGEPIYPGLTSLGSVVNAPEKPFHAVINAENYHALETLRYAYEEQVDAIYIDPPYNTGARDWKYNNDYVDGVDEYRHSKWLAFMERRLVLAERLLNPEDSVLVVTIDENEIHHLGVLLEQIFPDSLRQMVTIAVNGKGVAKAGQMSRVEEYAFFVFLGHARVAGGTDNLFNDEDLSEEPAEENPWASMLRRGTNAARADRPNMFYPVFVDEDKKTIAAVGESIDLETSRMSVTAPPGLRAVWPLRRDSSEGRWQIGPDRLRELIGLGYAKAGAYNSARDQWAILYLFKGQIDRIDEGDLEIVGHDTDGSVLLHSTAPRSVALKTVWNRTRHNAGTYGSGMLRTLIPGHTFPFPKSLYAVVDTLRAMVGHKRHALVVDFFAGSGTTAHALAYLNAEDGGDRRSVLVTNNEVSAEEATRLRAGGCYPGDEPWEQLGIFHHVTRPRLEAAITGIGPSGDEIEGTYLDGQAISAGLPENIEFFDLTYEDPDLITLGRKFGAVSPLLWLKAGATGPRVEDIESEWALPKGGRYGVLFKTQQWREFVSAANDNENVTHVFIITDSNAVYQQIVSELRTDIEPTQLYDDYLRAFQINTGLRS